MPELSPVGQRMLDAVVARYPEWAKYFGTKSESDLELAVPAPAKSCAGHLVIFSNGEDMWLRLGPPCMCYAVDDEAELLSIIDKLLADQVAFVTTWSGETWTGTTLIAAG